MPTTLYQQMQSTAQKMPNNTSVVFYGRRYTFGQMLDCVDSAAAGLASAGVKKGDVVTLCIPNTPSAQIAFYALNRMGAIVSLVHPYTAPPQLDTILHETKSVMLIAYDLYLREKGDRLRTDIKILQSRCDYFMSRPARLYFRWSNRKKSRWTGASFEDLFDSPAATTPPEMFGKEEPAVYLPSGGTCGTPKTIVHCNRVFNELCGNAAYFLSEPLQNYKAMYTVLPIFHGFGLCMNMHMCAVVGVKNVMSIKFSPHAMAKAIKKEGVNVITGVPTMYSRLLSCKQFVRADLSTIKDCFVGGDSAPTSLVSDFNAALARGGSKGRLYPGYGLAETVAVCVVNCAKHSRSGSEGKPLPGTRLRIVQSNMLCGTVETINNSHSSDSLATNNVEIVDSSNHNVDSSTINISDSTINSVFSISDIAGSTPLNYREITNSNSTNNSGEGTPIKDLPAGEVGEICVATSQLMLGYLGGEDSSVRTENGERWLFTGDLGYVDADGFLYFKQRAKNMIKVSGVPVYPSEIEAVCEAVEGVKRAAAMPMPDARWGSAVKLFVESDCADPEILKTQIMEKCRLSLMRYALPKAIEIRSALPLNSIGKIDRKKLERT